MVVLGDDGSSGISLSVGGNFNNSRGTVTLDGMSNGISVGGAFNNNRGTVILNGTGDTLSVGTFSNSGWVSVGSNETLTVQNNYTQDAGAKLNVDGTLTAATATINTGTVSGSGTIIANVSNVGGRVTASDSGIPEILTIIGNYTQGSGGTLEAFLGGTAAGTGYSQLVVGGTATLDGKLDVDLVSGFDPTLDENFFLLTSTGTSLVSGDFSNLELPSGDAWLVSYNLGCPTGTTGCVDLTYEGEAHVPEPSTFLLLALGMAAMAILVRYRHTALGF